MFDDEGTLYRRFKTEIAMFIELLRNETSLVLEADEMGKELGRVESMKEDSTAQCIAKNLAMLELRQKRYKIRNDHLELPVLRSFLALDDSIGMGRCPAH